MKAAYADVTRWVAFNAEVTRLEFQLCNAGCLAPLIAPFMAETGAEDRSGAQLSAIETLAGLVWQLEREHAALTERLRELFASRIPSELPTEVRALFEPRHTPQSNLLVLRRSIQTRMTLIADNREAVDAHTRLVLHRHLTILRTLVTPVLSHMIGAGAADDSAGDEGDRIGVLFDAYLPRSRRPHPDDFLALSLLT